MDWTYGGGAYYGRTLPLRFLIGIFGMGSYIFQVWEKFEHTLESNNSMLIKRGNDDTSWKRVLCK